MGRKYNVEREDIERVLKQIPKQAKQARKMKDPRGKNTELKKLRDIERNQHKDLKKAYDELNNQDLLTEMSCQLFLFFLRKSGKRVARDLSDLGLPLAKLILKDRVEFLWDQVHCLTRNGRSKLLAFFANSNLHGIKLFRVDLTLEDYISLPSKPAAQFTD